MPKYKDFSAWITIDGREAETPEYDIQVSENEKMVTCWIGSELGKKFTVHWKNSSYYDSDTSGHVKMDGVACGGLLMYRSAAPVLAHLTGVSDGTAIRPFIFSSLSITDDDAFLGGSSHQELGVIELHIYPSRIESRDVSATILSLSELKVHERSKKAVTQQITLGNAELLPQRETFVRSQRIGPDLVKFLFKYRPMDVLRANGIAPPLARDERKGSAEPELEPASTPDDLADAEEARILREKLAALEAKRIKKEKGKKPPRVKRELSSSSGPIIDLTEDRPSKRVKRERPFVQGEVIDLT
ncbi:hypothetical protein C8R43DRAFT_78095 [Mycena crocata]|nr:hypothetical protein C8R43DRAFT_78095 [Mycena crocata]